MKNFLSFSLALLTGIFALEAQQPISSPAKVWADSVLNTLSRDEKIAQLMILRASGLPLPGTTTAHFFDQEVEEAIRKYNIGGICFFQGSPQQQVARINAYQQLAKTPLLVTIDGEWGLGMRMDSVRSLPRPMMLGAVQNASLAYDYGQLVGQQCRRAGFQMNFAPVLDVNNNSKNPVINDRSFGENKYRVSLLGIQYMKGLQDAGIMACAKHFPGHGDVDVDSHQEMPLIPKSRLALDSVELYPFRMAIAEGIEGVMTAHLSVPAIDSSAHRPASVSYPVVTQLLKQELKFQGLTFTDALEMKGITKYYSPAEISLQAVLAGNDLLCLPAELPQSIALIRKAIRKHQLTWKDINARVVKILMAKYQAGLSRWKPLPLDHLTEDLNEGIVALQRKIAEASITLLRHETSALFLLPQGKRVAYIGLGIERDNELARIMRQTFQAHVYYFPYQLSTEQAQALSVFLRNQYDVVVMGLHNYSRRPAGNFGLSTAALQLIQQVQQQQPTITLTFGNPYAIKNFCTSPTLLACYEDDSITQQVAAELLLGKLQAKGKLPVRVCDQFPEGFGLTAGSVLPYSSPEALGFAPQKLRVIDSIVNDAIRMQSIPGAVVLVAKDGKVAYEKAFGYMAYDSSEAVRPETLYDLASVTKIMATTLSVMKLYEEGQIDLQKTIGDYLPWVKGSNKQDIRLWDVLLHQAGLKSWIPFYKETVDTTLGNIPLTTFYVSRPDASHRVRVASGMYMRQDWIDTMYQRILFSEKGAPGAYVYSDNDFIFLGKIVEAVSGMSLDRYVKQTFYDPLQLNRTVFRPRDYFPLTAIAPTEEELGFRQQLIRGDVHDPGAAMFGGVAGHAGLFSTAQDLAVIAELLLNGGECNGFKLFKPETIQLFTSYQSSSRRGLGFDKPERDNAIRPEPYPALSASPETFGHTGFTGTCVWMDPKQHLTFILLSNRVHNNGDPNCFLRMSVRPKVLEAVYQALR